MPTTFKVPINTLHLLNQNGARTELDQVALKDFIKQFPEFDNEVEGTANVTVSCHCELTVALYVAKFSPPNLEIGVSKGLCFLCEKFMEFFTSETKIRIFVSQFQGKMRGGWMLPPQASDSVKKNMHEVVNHEINDLRESIIRRRRSDSFPSVDQDHTVEEVFTRTSDRYW